MITTIIWIVILVLFPLLFVAWLLETPQEKAKRWRKAGMSQQRIADRLGVSRSKVRRILA